jgi:hypothetical protein
MPKKPTTADAQLILQLYDLRREAEMRKARAWFAGFWPEKAEDVVEVINNFGTQENAWYRQVSGYWDMAASLVLSGALNEELFTDCNGEMWFIFCKINPFLKEVREIIKTPQMMAHVEKLAKKSKKGRERLQALEKRFSSRRGAAAAASKS